MNELRPRALLCPRGTHDFGTGGALRCTKCRLTMQELKVEEGRELKRVTAANELKRVGSTDQTKMLPWHERARPGVVPITEPSDAFKRFASERYNESKAAADDHNATITKLVDQGMSRDAASKAMELMRAGVGPVEAFREAVRLYGAPHEPRPREALAVYTLDALAALAADPEPEQELLDAHVWNRADEVAKPYGIERRHGEDDDSLHTRIRAYVASRPGLYVKPPPMDWTPPAKPKAIPTAKRGPIIDVDVD